MSEQGNVGGGSWPKKQDIRSKTNTLDEVEDNVYKVVSGCLRFMICLLNMWSGDRLDKIIRASQCGPLADHYAA